MCITISSKTTWKSFYIVAYTKNLHENNLVPGCKIPTHPRYIYYANIMISYTLTCFTSYLIFHTRGGTKFVLFMFSISAPFEEFLVKLYKLQFMILKQRSLSPSLVAQARVVRNVLFESTTDSEMLKTYQYVAVEGVSAIFYGKKKKSRSKTHCKWYDIYLFFVHGVLWVFFFRVGHVDLVFLTFLRNVQIV